MKKHTTLFYVGNSLIILSLISLLFIVSPFVFMYVFPPSLKPITKVSNYSITVPKIDAQAPVIANVDPWNQSEYLQALKKGVAQAKRTALPGQNGTTYLFAHSSGPPWDEARYNTIFLRLGELQKNDLIIIYRNGKRYNYLVTEKKVVNPSDVAYLVNKGPKTDNQLILQTCTPIGTDWNRLLIFAKLN